MRSALKSVVIFLSVVVATALLPSISTTVYAQTASQEEKIISKMTIRKVEEKAVRESIKDATIGIGKATIKVVGRIAESEAIILQVAWPSDIQWSIRGMPFVCIDKAINDVTQLAGCPGFKQFTAPASYTVNWVVNDPETVSLYSKFWSIFGLPPVGLGWLYEGIKGDVSCASDDDFHLISGLEAPKGGSRSFDNVGPGTYKFSVTCSVPPEDRWYVKIINWFTDLFGSTPTRGPVTHSAFVATRVIPAPTQVTSFSVALYANPTTLSGPGSAMLTAVASRQNISGNINYTFYCNRSDTGTNITSGYIAKFDNRSELTQSASCFYNNVGVYTAKVIAESGAKVAQDQATIVVNSPPAAPGKPAVDIKVQ